MNLPVKTGFADLDAAIARIALWETDPMFSAASPRPDHTFRVTRAEISERWLRASDAFLPSGLGEGRISPANEASQRRSSREATAVGYATDGQLASRWAFYGGKCWMCDAPAAHMDHVKPLARGGSNWPANQRPACWPCNRRKAAHWPLPAWTEKKIA
jgi:hypothetical protein